MQSAGELCVIYITLFFYCGHTVHFGELSFFRPEKQIHLYVLVDARKAANNTVNTPTVQTAGLLWGLHTHAISDLARCPDGHAVASGYCMSSKVNSPYNCSVFVLGSLFQWEINVRIRPVCGCPCSCMFRW